MGNKADLGPTGSSVRFQEAATYADKISATSHEVSAKDGTGIDELFHEVAVKMHDAIVADRGDFSMKDTEASQKSMRLRGPSVKLIQKDGVKTK